MDKRDPNGWIQTYGGHQFWPLDPRVEEIHLEDIAHALSMLCRFNGHCMRFYSVAEHSVHISYIVPPEHALWGLMHDAAEAYLADIPIPIKRTMDDYARHEAHLLRLIARRFALSEKIPAEIRQADRQMLATEKLALMRPEPAPWMPLPDPLDPAMIQALPPQEAEQLFLNRYVLLSQNQSY
ncbi:MAG: phosphohydrolase [Magnetococcales bacterium]|nr:phosphohydrolase [Magnetococcales bacterium]